VNIAPIKRIAIEYEAAKLSDLRSFIRIHLAVEIGCEIIRGFCQRDAIFFGSPTAEIDHFATFGAERLPLVAFPTCLTTAPGASSNFRVIHRSPENLRD
jgi:hypothetical protein